MVDTLVSLLTNLVKPLKLPFGFSVLAGVLFHIWPYSCGCRTAKWYIYRGENFILMLKLHQSFQEAFCYRNAVFTHPCSFLVKPYVQIDNSGHLFLHVKCRWGTGDRHRLPWNQRVQSDPFLIWWFCCCGRIRDETQKRKSLCVP